MRDTGQPAMGSEFKADVVSLDGVLDLVSRAEHGLDSETGHFLEGLDRHFVQRAHHSDGEELAHAVDRYKLVGLAELDGDHADDVLLNPAVFERDAWGSGLFGEKFEESIRV